MPGLPLTRCLALGALLGVAAPARAASPQQVRLQVAVPAELQGGSLRAEVERLGEQQSLALEDEGRVRWDIPGDGVFVGELDGDYARTLSLALVLDLEGAEHTVFAGVLRTDDARLATLGFRLLATPTGPTAVRVPMPYPGGGGETHEVLQLVAAFGWGLLVLAYVAVLVLGGGPRRRRGGAAGPS